MFYSDYHTLSEMMVRKHTNSTYVDICDFGFEYLVAQNMISNMVLKDKYENKHLYAGFVYIFIFLMKQLVSVVL